MSSKVNHAKRSHRSETRHYRAAVNRKIGAASKLRNRKEKTNDRSYCSREICRMQG